MRNSINGAWLFGIVLTFMTFFIAFISISINYSQAFRLKTKIITTLEQNNGLNTISLEHINNIAGLNATHETSVCHLPKGYDGGEIVGISNGVPTKVLGTGETNVKNSPQEICISRVFKSAKNQSSEDGYYYHVEVFFGFSLPLMEKIFTFRVTGETNKIDYPAGSDFFN